VEYLRKLQEFEDRNHPNHFLVNGHQLAGSQPARAGEGLVPVIAWDRVL
jgi:hypothetical protein